MAAEKTFPLSIVIRTVDQATAGFRKINHQLDALTRPTREFGKELSHLAEKSGLNRVGEAFKGVGEALKETAIHLLEVGAIAGEMVHLLIEKFTNLATTAKLVGLTADQLAQFRFAAKQSGVSVEEFDSGLEKLNKSLGEMKAGGGKLKSLLEKVSPVLLRQIQSAKSNVEAFDLLANAMVKVTDPTKRAALATAAFGRGGQPLINMLSQGAEGIDALRKEYEQLAGSQDAAAESALELHHAQGRIAAMFDGIEASIITAVAPVLLKLADQFKSFLVEHREEIAAFIKDFGEKLPGRIQAVVDAFRSALNFIKPVWDAIDRMGGAATVLAAILGGKLVFAIARLGLALALTPFGWVLAGIAALVAGAALLIANWDKVSAFFADLWLGIKQTFADAIAWITQAVADIIDAINPLNVFDGKLKGAFGQAGAFVGTIERPTVGALLPGMAGPNTATEARIKVDFKNAPKGMRVTTDPKSTADVDLSVGYQMVLP